MEINKTIIKYSIIFFIIIITFVGLNKMLTLKEVKENKQQKTVNETKTIENFESEKERPIDFNTDLFEVISTSQLPQMDVYILGDKKTGLCYLVVKDENGISISDYKANDGKQFNIMSYQSYVSPYEQSIQNAVIGGD